MHEQNCHECLLADGKVVLVPRHQCDVTAGHVPGSIARLRFYTVVFSSLQLTQLRVCAFVKLFFKFAADSIACVRVCKAVCAFVGCLYS